MKLPLSLFSLPWTVVAVVRDLSVSLFVFGFLSVWAENREERWRLIRLGSAFSPLSSVCWNFNALLLQREGRGVPGEDPRRRRDQEGGGGRPRLSQVA